MTRGTVQGDQLRTIRQKAGVTRKQLADAARCSTSHLWHIEMGHRQYVSIELLHRFATHLSQALGREVAVEEFIRPAPVCTCARSA
jgi:transcriptional regulator with XRE-family HTH domain